jgi:UDP-N-acetyl-D-galactosamine dehydrogenase
LDYSKKNIVVVGLGYVGLPLAVNFANTFDVIGYDISDARINSLKNFKDSTKEISSIKLKKAKRLKFSSNIDEIKKQHIYIITVPTPVNDQNLPDLTLLKAACKLVGKVMAKNAIVIFESTVYPGVTRKICAPIIAKYSSYKCNKSFFIGYSPERINPGDKKHSVEKIIKVVSGSNKSTTLIIGKIYKRIIKAGIFYAESIEVAETAKAIENAQRDINIAFVNEISLLCQKLNISVYDVLNAAKTKWNFLPFHPGLVGGHCIGVDPYYLAHIAKKLGVETNVILSGRHLNDKMTEKIYHIIKKNISKKFRILQLGISFKENVPDIRNSKAAELANLFINNNYNIEIYDPVADKVDVHNNFKINLCELTGKYDCVIIAVSHKFLKNNTNIINYIKEKAVVFDITGKYKNIFNNHKFKYWSL